MPKYLNFVKSYFVIYRVKCLAQVKKDTKNKFFRCDAFVKFNFNISV